MKSLAPRPINPHLLLALALAFAYHGSLLLAGSFRKTYDALIHIFFADHYARAWFDHWEYRWYTGFSMTSYPPGSQQSIGLLSHVVGLQNGFIIVQLGAVLFLTLGIYRFSKLWVSEEAAGYAALLTVFASSINETIHVFGQLPTSFSIGFLLNALPYVKRWLDEGRWSMLITAWLFNGATTAGHHVTTLFGAVFFVGPVIVSVISEKLFQPLRIEATRPIPPFTWNNLFPWLLRYGLRILPVCVRSALYCVGLGVMLIFVVYPYWQLSKSDPIVQVPIPHSSRDSFIANPNAGLVFWLLPYGLTLCALPYILYKGFRTRAWPIACSFCMLFLLGTGGTTPIPKMLLRGAFDIVTLDRFTFWATILMFPLLGELVVSIRHGRIAEFIRAQFGGKLLYAFQVLCVVSYLAMAVFTANFTQFRRFQPAAIDMGPIVTFLGKDEHWRWRYMTLGFGDQMAWLSALTTATTVDGNYHSARRLPELVTTPVERLEGAKFRGIPGIGSLQQFLAVPDKYNLKFIFSNDQFYDPLLYFSGWHQLQRLENGIIVWEREDISPLPEVLPRKEIPISYRIMWGTVPMGAIFSALLAMTAPLWASSLMRLFRMLGIPLLWQRLQRCSLIPKNIRHILTSPMKVIRKGFHFIWLLFFYDVLGKDSAPVGATRSRRTLSQIFSQLLSHLPPLPHSYLNRIWGHRSFRWFLVGLVVFVPLLGSFLLFSQAQKDPVTIVQDYYDDLDFRRFEEAYSALDPLKRPSFEQYMLELSVKNGLVASYGKLDSIVVSMLTREPTRLIVQVKTVWITSLYAYPTIEKLVLVKRQGNWYITPAPVNLSTPPDQFFRRGTLSWHSVGRSLTTTETTSFGDILDRPQLQILSARLVQWHNRYSVVGELINTDVNPADLTVEAVLFDRHSHVLTRYNAQTAIMHKVLPKEVTPFRVDFEGVAGAALNDMETAGEFNPTATSPVNLKAAIKTFEVYAKAVVTGRNLQRGLAIQNIETTTKNGQAFITGTVFNTGTFEATIPHMLVTYYDKDKHVLWVDNFYLQEAIRPETSEAFELPITPYRTVKSIIDKGNVYTNPLQQNVDLAVAEQTWREILPLPPTIQYASMRISLHQFIAIE